ncbi:hypothetical protein RHGRI_000761 [Rhododendron griersonianum]|uniref:Serine-rich protein n=1 Tax=Rhododendron griersonianum TaxID=479676 RepID=A0AAV6LIY8_9ERIC|nr:hypothetical protein RHGRI_000761 [Rhododendron griersonianum]
MDSSCRIRVTTTTTTSPKAGKGSADSAVSPSQKGGQCLCSPTTHKGSFRCRFHRSTTTTPPPPWFKRSNSMPPDRSSVANSLSPKSADS